MKQQSMQPKARQTRLFAFLVMTFLVIAIAASAQKDVSTRLISPATGSNIYKAIPDTVSFMVKNNGMMAISMADTIGVMITVNGGMPAMYGTMAMINPGDSQLITISSFSYSAFMSNTDNVSFCAGVMIMGNTDPTPADNNSCHNVNLRLPVTTGIALKDAQSITVYPNPANNVLNIHAGEAVTGKLQIIDMSGKEIIVTEVNGTDITVPVNNLAAGSYFYQLMNTVGGRVKSGKISILH